MITKKKNSVIMTNFPLLRTDNSHKLLKYAKFFAL